MGFRPLREVHRRVAHVAANRPSLIRLLRRDRQRPDRVLAFPVRFRRVTVRDVIGDFVAIRRPRHVRCGLAVVGATDDVVRSVDDDADDRSAIYVRLIGRSWRQKGER